MATNERPKGVVKGSGRRGASKALPTAPTTPERNELAEYWKARYHELAKSMNNNIERMLSTEHGFGPDSPEPPVGSEIFHKAMPTSSPQWIHQSDGWWCDNGRCTTCPRDWAYVLGELGSVDWVRVPEA